MTGDFIEIEKMAVSLEETEIQDLTQGRQVTGGQLETLLSLRLRPKGRPHSTSVLKMVRRRTQEDRTMDQEEAQHFLMGSQTR